MTRARHDPAFLAARIHQEDRMTAPNWRTEFPDFPADAMPAIPAGFIDMSWHHDACPSFDNEAARLRLWVNYPDPEQREFSVSRFLVSRLDPEGEHAGDVAATDDWAEALEAIANNGGTDAL